MKSSYAEIWRMRGDDYLLKFAVQEWQLYRFVQSNISEYSKARTLILHCLECLWLILFVIFSYRLYLYVSYDWTTHRKPYS